MQQAAREGGVYAELARLQALNEAEGKELHQKSFDPADKEVDKLMHSSKDADVATKEDSPEEAAAKKAAAVALQRSRQKRLMGLAFSNGCEIFQLVIACLMVSTFASLQRVADSAHTTYGNLHCICRHWQMDRCYLSFPSFSRTSC